MCVCVCVHTHMHTCMLACVYACLYVQVYQLEEVSETDKAKGIEARFLDMAELKEGNQVLSSSSDPQRYISLRNGI